MNIAKLLLPVGIAIGSHGNMEYNMQQKFIQTPHVTDKDINVPEIFMFSEERVSFQNTGERAYRGAYNPRLGKSEPIFHENDKFNSALSFYCIFGITQTKLADEAYAQKLKKINNLNNISKYAKIYHSKSRF